MSESDDKIKKPADTIPKILIIDDNQATLDLMKKFFQKAEQRKDLNCEIIEAHNGDEAIQMINVAQPNIILCDINMPQKNGFEVLDYFKNEREEADPYGFFIFLSAAAEQRKKAFEKGADGFISKMEINYYIFTLQIKAWLRLVYLQRDRANYF
jgi:CheY-like chemotaxis protein